MSTILRFITTLLPNFFLCRMSKATSDLAPDSLMSSWLDVLDLKHSPIFINSSVFLEPNTNLYRSHGGQMWCHSHTEHVEMAGLHLIFPNVAQVVYVPQCFLYCVFLSLHSLASCIIQCNIEVILGLLSVFFPRYISDSNSRDAVT